MRKLTLTLDWQVIETAARSLGVTEKNLEQWRQRRSVPHKWRLRILRWTEQRKIKLPLEAFEREMRA